MKKINYRLIIPTAAILVIFFAACSKFLDKTPVGTLSPSVLYNEKGIQGLLIGAYSLLDGEGGNGSGWGSAASNWVYGSVCADDAYKGSTPDDQQEIAPLEQWTATSSNGYPSGKWALCYDGVQRANEVLRALPLATDIPADEVTEITAEARFLRGHYHFELKKVFNNVPFISETVVATTKPGEVSNVDGSGNYVDIYPLIEADFQAAVDGLPETQPEGIGRVNKWAAMAFLAKLYMFEGQYDKAKPLLEQLISSGKTASGVKYALVNYQSNFNPSTKNNSESVFAAQMSVNDGSGTAQANGNGVANGNYGDVLNFPYNGGPSGCCGFFNPSQSLANAYKTDANGLPLLDGSYNNGVDVDAHSSPYAGTLDPRIDWVMGRPGIDYLGFGPVPADDGWIRHDQGPNGRFVPKKSAYSQDQKGTFSSTESAFWGSTQLTANNVNLIRYADILLWAAECEISGSGGDPSKALDYVNQVRTRAADPTGWVYANATYSSSSSTYAPQNTPAGNYKIKTYPAGAFNDKAYALKAIQFERRLEFAMEGQRFFDLVRWGIADQVLNAYSAYEAQIKNCYIYYSKPTFTKGKNEYFAIPISQIDILNSDGNTNLKQNPGY